MTAFVESFATLQLLPPWQADGARTWRFAIRLDPLRVAAYLNTYFNGFYPDQAPFNYAPVPGAQFGLLSACYYPNVRSLQRSAGSDPISGGQVWDRLTHTEVYFAIPVLRYAVNRSGLMTTPTLVWVQPFAYSDNDTVVFSSREIWGADMFLATITRDVTLPPDQLHLDVGMVGIKHFSPRSVDELLACLHVKAVDPSPCDLPAILKANPDLQAFVDILGGSGQFAGGRPPPGVKTSPYASGIEMDNLKQFRDCYDMGAAIYRAIVASRTDLANVGEVVLYDAGKVELDFMYSDTLREMLASLFGAGIPPDNGPPADHAPGVDSHSGAGMDWNMNRVTLKPELAFAFQADITFNILGTIHTYGVSA
jgi:hypothetical protein